MKLYESSFLYQIWVLAIKDLSFIHVFYAILHDVFSNSSILTTQEIYYLIIVMSSEAYFSHEGLFLGSYNHL